MFIIREHFWKYLISGNMVLDECFINSFFFLSFLSPQNTFFLIIVKETHLAHVWDSSHICCFSQEESRCLSLITLGRSHVFGTVCFLRMYLKVWNNALRLRTHVDIWNKYIWSKFLKAFFTFYLKKKSINENSYYLSQVAYTRYIFFSSKVIVLSNLNLNFVWKCLLIFMRKPQNLLQSKVCN